MNLRDKVTLGLVLYGLGVWLVLLFIRGCSRKETPHVRKED